MVLGYFIIAFVVFFFSWKRWNTKMFEDLETSDAWMGSGWFWAMLTMSSAWIVAIPIYLAWQVLDKIYNSIFNR